MGVKPKWIDFIEAPLGGISVTEKGKPHLVLGFIGWYSQWRKFVFSPYAHTVYEQDCLRDIADYCEQATQRKRAKKWE